MTSTISIMRPTITGEPPVMVGLAAQPIPIVTFNLNGTRHLYVQGFDRVVGLNIPDLQNQWRRITSDPQTFLEAAIEQTKADIAELNEDIENDEGEIEEAERDLYSFRMFQLLIDHAVENAKRPAFTPPMVDELDAAILALPGVTRVKRHGSILRVLVNTATKAPDESIPAALAAYHQNEALLHLARLVGVVVSHNEEPSHLAVHLEPGLPPDGYELIEGDAGDGRRTAWKVFSWRQKGSLQLSPSQTDPALALDDAWDHLARSEAES